MSETKFKGSMLGLAMVQSHMHIFNEDRQRVLQAMGALKVAEEMYGMLHYASLLLENSPELDSRDAARDIINLLAKARGEV